MPASELQQPSAGSPRARTVVVMCVLLALAVIILFGRSYDFGCLGFDDGEYFSANDQVQAGLTWKGVRWAMLTGHASNWHPVTWLSLMLDVELWGHGPAGPHVTNVILHAVNAVLLFLLLRRLTSRRGEPDARVSVARADTTWASFFVAAIFAMHPLRVESVVWVSERKDVLSGLFFMLTLWAYAAYAKAGGSHSKSRIANYILSLILFALGLMSKPMLVTVPFLLLLLDYWPLRRTGPRSQISSATIRFLVLEKTPFLIMSAVSCWVTVWSQGQALKPTTVLPLGLRLGNAVVAYVEYAFQLFWPVNLAVFYPYQFNTPVWAFAAAGTLLLCTTGLVFWAARQRPYLVTGWLWYLGMLVPVIGLVQVGGQAHADRYTYLPQIGLLIALIWLIEDRLQSWRAPRLVFGIVSLGVGAALFVCTWRQVLYWQDDQSLWEHAIACTTGNYTAENNLGYVLAAQGRNAEAIGHYQKALKYFPEYPEAESNLGTALLNQGRFGEAIQCFLAALKVDPRFAEPYNNLGIIYASQGRSAEAVEQYQKAIQLNPGRAEVHNNLGNVLMTQGRMNEAARQFEMALSIKPDYAKAHYSLANILASQGRMEEAIAHYRPALQAMPAFAHGHYQFGLALQICGEFPEAKAQFQKVVELEPENVAAINNLAWLLATCPDDSLRDGSRAVELATNAERLTRGQSPEILDTLAAAYADTGRFAEAVETIKRSLSIATARNNQTLASALQNRLKLYEGNHPFRDPGLEHSTSGAKP